MHSSAACQRLGRIARVGRDPIPDWRCHGSFSSLGYWGRLCRTVARSLRIGQGVQTLVPLTELEKRPFLNSNYGCTIADRFVGGFGAFARVPLD
jgi:hypothetical protein